MRALLGVWIAAIALVPAAAGAVAPAQCGKLLPPGEGVYFGVMPGWPFSLPTTYDDIVDPLYVQEFEQLTGRKVVFAPWSISWHSGLPFPREDVAEIWRAGYVPHIRVFSWPVQGYAPVPQPTPPGPVASSMIAVGAQDATLRAFARAARVTNIPISFNYDPEMTAAHPWSGRFDGGGTTTQYGDPTWPDGPERFRDAYRRIVTIFREEGATNVTFFFHANSVNGYMAGSFWEPWEQLRFYYPGDEYIDWLGLSVYSEKLYQTGPNESFEDKLAFGKVPGYGGPYAEITALGSKPLAIAEMGLYSLPNEEAKAQWVEEASAALRSGRYGRVGAINWWAANKGGEYDAYPYTTTSSVFLDGFKRAFNQPFFDAKPHFGGNCRPLAPANVRLRKGTLRWSPIPNASSYEVWRGPKLLRRTGGTAVTVPKRPARYRVRGVNIVGAGPFASAR